MNFISAKHTTKRGNIYVIRKTKLANGMSQVLADRTAPRLGHDFGVLLSLAVHGTIDSLRNGITFYKIRIEKKHPIDQSYHKFMFRLNDRGRRRLNSLR